MITIQISSDPYKRKITYEMVNGNQLTPIDSSNPDTPEKLKLLSVDYSDCFFPFKAYEIAELIWHTYSTSSIPVCIQFRGTTEEYRELCSVCDILNAENKKLLPEEQLPELKYRQADEYLANAGDILPEVTGYFKSIKDIIANNITASDSKNLIEQQQEKFDDVSKKEIPVCVIGNYSSGKSTFINAILGCEVLPSGDKPLTAKIYEIRCSDNSEVANVEFTSNNMVVTISFYRGGYTIRPENYNDELSAKIHECLEREKDNTLSGRVQMLLQVINDGDIEDRVKIHIPFNSDSPLRNSEHPYVLFDTPGDNVANHERHIQVLQDALRGMSNGLMLYVTVSNQLHTMSNQQLCDKVKAIQEIDTRFTMVIVNQADNADFSEYNRTEIIESPIPITLQPEGIYYVSSIMALGSKIDGNFVKDNNAMIYMQKENFFLKNKGERFAQLLFLYNIAPKQIEMASCQGAIHYGEYGSKERIFANSGLWAIEQEIQRFADNYAPYNKCYQSLLFLLKVREIAESYIADAIEIHNKSRIDYQSQLDGDKKKLLGELKKSRDEFVENANIEYPTEMESYKKDAYKSVDKDQFVKLENELTTILETNENYSEKAESADKAMERTFKIKNIFNADIRADIKQSYKYWRDKSNDRDEARKKIDTDAADQLLTQVKELFNITVNQAQNILFQSSSNYWKTKAEELRKNLLSVVLESSDISQERRDKLQNLIEGFEHITFSGEVEKIFDKEIYERHTLFKIFEDHRLNKRKLASRFNSSLKDGIDSMYYQMKNSHEKIFKNWQTQLFSVIEDNVTELNPQLKESKKQVAFYEGLIESLETAKNALIEYIDKIDRLMDWKPIAEENTAE